MTLIRTTFIVAVITVALSAGALAQAMSGTSGAIAYEAQSDRAAHAALEVVQRGQVVSIAHDHEGDAFWAVEIFDPAAGRHVVVYLDRDFDRLRTRVSSS